MNFEREKIKDYHLRDTLVENIFISEYMPGADAEAVKVYLLALMCADEDEGLTNEMIGKQLGIKEEDVLRAWSFWEKRNVIKKHYDSPGDSLHYQVEFLNLKERLYGSQIRTTCDENVKLIPKSLKSQLRNDKMVSLYDEIEAIIGRLFDGNEPATIISWINDFGMTPDAVKFAYNYCVNVRKNNKFKYVASVVKEWAKDNLKTVDDIKAVLDETDNRRFLYKRVMKALGFQRNPTEAEEKIMDKWFDDYGADINLVLEACNKSSGISNPNINYINRIVEDKCGTKPADQKGRPGAVKNPVAAVQKQYEELRERNLGIIEERRKNVYVSVPKIKVIDEELRRINKTLSKAMLAGGVTAQERVKEIRKKIVDLNGEKAFLLTEENLPPDYLEVKFTCNICKDTGMLESGERCKCFNEKLMALQNK